MKRLHIFGEDRHLRADEALWVVEGSDFENQFFRAGRWVKIWVPHLAQKSRVTAFSRLGGVNWAGVPWV